MLNMSTVYGYSTTNPGNLHVTVTVVKNRGRGLVASESCKEVAQEAGSTMLSFPYSGEGCTVSSSE